MYTLFQTGAIILVFNCLKTCKSAPVALFKDVCTHCYYASLVHTLFNRHARATSFSSAQTKSKIQQNVELMTFALTWWANIFVGCSVINTFFGQITSFSDSFHYPKKQKNLYVESFNYFSYTFHIGSNWYMNTGVHDLEIAFFLRLILPNLMTYVAKIYQIGL